MVVNVLSVWDCGSRRCPLLNIGLALGLAGLAFACFENLIWHQC